MPYNPDGRAGGGTSPWDPDWMTPNYQSPYGPPPEQPGMPSWMQYTPSSGPTGMVDVSGYTPEEIAYYVGSGLWNTANHDGGTAYWWADNPQSNYQGPASGGQAPPAPNMPYGPPPIGPGGGQQLSNQYDAQWWMNQLRDIMSPSQGPAAPDFQQWGGGAGYQAPDAWQAPEWSLPDTGFDVRDAMDAMQPLLNERMGGEMGSAAAMAGNAGVMGSSDYVNALGQAQRGRDADLANMAYQYQFQASQADADRIAAAQQAAAARDLAAWQTHGGWQHQGSMADQDRAYDAWARENDWNMDRWMGEQNQWQGQWGQNMDMWNAIMAMMSQFGL